MRKLLLLSVSLVLAGAAHAQTPAQQQGPGGDQPGRRHGDFAARFKSMDTDGDGAVSKAEWLAAGHREDAFARIDANGDGKITPEEMRAAFRRFQQTREVKK